MVFEGLSINDEAVKQMSRADFVRSVADVHWRDKSVDDRKKLAEQCYDLLCGKADKPKETAVKPKQKKSK